MRVNGTEVERFTNSMMLDDGRIFLLTFIRSGYYATFDDPEEWDYEEPEYFIDRESKSREELPEELTDAIIEELKYNASPDPSFDPREPY